MDPTLCKVSPYLHHTTQSIVIKEGKNDRIVWDGSMVIKPTDISLPFKTKDAILSTKVRRFISIFVLFLQ